MNVTAAWNWLTFDIIGGHTCLPFFTPIHSARCGDILRVKLAYLELVSNMRIRTGLVGTAFRGRSQIWRSGFTLAS